MEVFGSGERLAIAVEVARLRRLEVGRRYDKLSWFDRTLGLMYITFLVPVKSSVSLKSVLTTGKLSSVLL